MSEPKLVVQLSNGKEFTNLEFAYGPTFVDTFVMRMVDDRKIPTILADFKDLEWIKVIDNSVGGAVIFNNEYLTIIRCNAFKKNSVRMVDIEFSKGEAA